MQRQDETTSSGLYGGERGAGGKLRKPPSRKPHATPYDRPPPNQSRSDNGRGGGGGWFSKPVNLAYRLISGGATRMLPYFFSKSPSTDVLPTSDDQDYDKLHTEVQEDANNDRKGTLNFEISRSAGVAGPSGTAEGAKPVSGFDRHIQDKQDNLPDDSGLSEIEQLMKGKKFSRDQIDRLTEILYSRAADLSNFEREKKNPIVNTGREAEGNLNAHEISRKSVEVKLDLNRSIWGVSTPLPSSTIQDEVGASPVEIARAYMGTRTSEIGLGSKSIIAKDERTFLHSDNIASNPFIASPSPKPPICWPGAMVQDQRSYLTPQGQRSRLGVNNFPRTPYSRTIFSKPHSKSTQSQADSSRHLNTPSTPLLQSQSPIFEQVKSRSNVLDDGNGSVGPIRRIRNKTVLRTPRGPSFSHSALHGPALVENSDASKGFFPDVKKNLQPGASSSTSKFLSLDNKPHSNEVSVPTVHPQSSLMARKILEHLDRNPPTPKEKLDELKLATTWKKPSSSEVATTSENTGSEHRSNSLFKVQQPERRANEATDSVNKNASVSNIVFGNTTTKHNENAGPSLVSKKSLDVQIKSPHEKAIMGFHDGKQNEKNHLWPLQLQTNGQHTSKMVHFGAGSEVPNLQKKPQPQVSGIKPILTSISINKPDPSTISSNNSSGFTFPVSASFGVHSEPPTPSIMPLFSASSVHQPKEGHAIPSYSFGSKSSNPALVFSFPSTSSASVPNDASNLKFNFGSDQKTRLSFSSVGKDAITYVN